MFSLQEFNKCRSFKNSIQLHFKNRVFLKVNRVNFSKYLCRRLLKQQNVALLFDIVEALPIEAVSTLYKQLDYLIGQIVQKLKLTSQFAYQVYFIQRPAQTEKNHSKHLFSNRSCC